MDVPIYIYMPNFSSVGSCTLSRRRPIYLIKLESKRIPVCSNADSSPLCDCCTIISLISHPYPDERGTFYCPRLVWWILHRKGEATKPLEAQMTHLYMEIA